MPRLFALTLHSFRAQNAQGYFFALNLALSVLIILCAFMPAFGFGQYLSFIREQAAALLFLVNFLALTLGARLFIWREVQTGNAAVILSAGVSRTVYVAGRVAGLILSTFLLCFNSFFVLQTALHMMRHENHADLTVLGLFVGAQGLGMVMSYAFARLRGKRFFAVYNETSGLFSIAGLGVMMLVQGPFFDLRALTVVLNVLPAFLPCAVILGYAAALMKGNNMFAAACVLLGVGLFGSRYVPGLVPDLNACFTATLCAEGGENSAAVCAQLLGMRYVLLWLLCTVQALFYMLVCAPIFSRREFN